jgi:hypothetical protein
MLPIEGEVVIGESECRIAWINNVFKFIVLLFGQRHAHAKEHHALYEARVIQSAA